MKLISWNVNGIRACAQKGFLEFFKEADADIFCIQETKMQEGQLRLDLPGYYQYWNYAVKKGYSGTAVFAKKEPLNVTYGIGRKDASSHVSLTTFILSRCIPRTHRMNWRGLTTA